MKDILLASNDAHSSDWLGTWLDCTNYSTVDKLYEDLLLNYYNYKLARNILTPPEQSAHLSNKNLKDILKLSQVEFLICYINFESPLKEIQWFYFEGFEKISPKVSLAINEILIYNSLKYNS